MLIRSLLISSVIVALCCCSLTDDLSAGRAKLQEMQLMLAKVPSYAGSVEVGTKARSGVGTAITGKNYRSDASYEDLKKFYIDVLSQQGWQLATEKPVNMQDPAGSERLLFFCKQDYSLTVQYAGRQAGYGWDYAIDLVWPNDYDCRGPKK